MISLGSLSAFSAGTPLAPLVRPTASATPTGAAMQVRAQSTTPSTTQQALPQTPVVPAGKKLPRGSLLNLQV